MRILLLFLSLPLFVSCRTSTPETQKPTIEYQVTQREIERLPSAFAPLSPTERASDWGKELTIGKAFGKELDLYRATTAFKRALILIGEENSERKKEIFYDLLLAYYLAGKKDEICETFEKSDFTIKSDFPAVREFFLILYDSYLWRGQMTRSNALKQYLERISPELLMKVNQYTHLTLQELEDPSLHAFSKAYKSQKKSPFKAGLFNAVIPGAGYLYVGQKQTALTSLCLNAVFIVATYEFFHAGMAAAGIISGSLECGWYIGGINGASESAKDYNKTLYRALAGDFASRERLFPFLQFQYGF